MPFPRTDHSGRHECAEILRSRAGTEIADAGVDSRANEHRPEDSVMMVRSMIHGGRRSPGRGALTGVVAVGVGLSMCGCSKVNVTPLGSTHEGRPQFEIACNRPGSDADDATSGVERGAP